ncbi:MAG TPA: ChbG/HpnK family deacetylase [Enhygromyxa sp.]|nr:ChbG/HpnK family deacetylase [Enhygromyxa sp.]
MNEKRKRLIVNADDFGASRGINRGVAEAHRRGIVTSTSLMVTMPRAADAAAMAADMPELGIGLHAVLTREDARPLLPFDDPDRCRAELLRQLDQFERLMKRPPTHLDAHHNIHRDPRLTPVFLAVASELGLPLREHSAARYFSSFYGQWDDGETHLEQIGVEMLCRMLGTELCGEVTELGCHPGHVDPEFPSSYSIEREAELRTLCDPRVREAVRALEISLITHADAMPLPRSCPEGPAS